MKFGRFPLHEAAIRGDEEMAELFLSHGAHLNGKDHAGRRFFRLGHGEPADYYPPPPPKINRKSAKKTWAPRLRDNLNVDRIRREVPRPSHRIGEADINARHARRQGPQGIEDGQAFTREIQCTHEVREYR